MYWLLVELVMSLKSSHKEPVRKLLLYEDYNDITIPTSNQIPDIHIAVSAVYHNNMTHFKNSFSCMRFNIVYSFILTVIWN